MLIRLFFLKLLVLTNIIIVAIGTSTAYAWTFGPVKFESYDGTVLDGQLFKPDNYNQADSLPGIILVPGWALPKEATYPNAIEFANRGYVVLSYSPRGYGLSEGFVNTAGPKDREDFSSALDWLLNNTKVDVNRIGSGGTSYGGIVPTNSASFDERVSVLAMFDMPTEVVDAFYQGESPNAFWTRFLELASRVGRPDPVIKQNLNDLFDHSRIPEIIDWALERSPMEFIDQINDRQVPVFMSLSYRDRMFRPNSGMRYFEALTGPKILQLQDGIHGIPEDSADDYRQDTYFDWFDYWLRDIDNGIMERPMADFQLHRSKERVTYEFWPSPNIAYNPIYLSPNEERLTGDLLLEPNIINDIWALDSLFFGNQESKQPTTGDPLVDAQKELYVNFETLDPDLAHSYQSDFLPQGLKLRGTPTVNLRIQAWDEQVQIVAYLYQINPNGEALYLTHGARTFYDLYPGELIDTEIELTTLMYDFVPGSRIGLAFDAQDPQFVRPPQRFFSLDVIHSEFQPNVLWLPTDGDIVYAGAPDEDDLISHPEQPGDSTPDRAVNNGSVSGGGSGGSLGVLMVFAGLLASLRRRSA